MLKRIVLILLISHISFAQEAVYLNKDDKSPFSGYLLPEDKLKSLRNDSLENTANKQIIDRLNKSINLYQTNSDLKDKQLKLYSDQNDQLVKSLVAEENLNTWEKILYFGGGIVLTGLAIYGAHSLYK